MTTTCKHERTSEISGTIHCLDCEPVERISLTDTAKLIRAELKRAFPDTKFSVRSKSYSGGSSIDVSYVDGPPSKAVDAIAKKFEGATFDGMQDLKTRNGSLYNGKPVQFGPDYVFVSRSYKDEHGSPDEFGIIRLYRNSPQNRILALLKERINYNGNDYLADQNAWQILSTWDARWETLGRAVERYMHENVAGYKRIHA